MPFRRIGYKNSSNSRKSKILCYKIPALGPLVEYMKMMDILLFSKAERKGDWTLHLQAIYQMLPHFAAARHNNYTKSSYIYIQQMQDLQKTNLEIYGKCMDVFQVARCSDRFWGDLSNDLTIEQVLMRKNHRRLTRGKAIEVY